MFDFLGYNVAFLKLHRNGKFLVVVCIFLFLFELVSEVNSKKVGRDTVPILRDFLDKTT